MADFEVAPLALTFKCTGCNHDKPISAFRRDAAKPRGFNTRCRACSKIRDHSRAAITIALIDESARKLCRRCRSEKPLSEFAKDLRQRDGRCTRCRPCAALYAAEWRQRRARGEDTSKKLVPRKRSFGVDDAEYRLMMETQSYACAICERPFERKIPNKHVNIDHNHQTMRVRGLLCTSCNLGLGSFREDITVMQRAISYLVDHSNG